MNDENPTMGSAEPPLDLATINADDAMLDVLGHGASAPAGDDVSVLLAAWRADLAGDSPAAEDAGPGAIGPGAIGPGATGPGAGGLGAGGSPARRPRRRALARTVIGVAAAAVVAAALALGSNHAGPHSPLWPITQILHPEQAEIRAAEDAIAQAQAATDPDEARRLLDEAAGHAARVRDPAIAQRLRDEIDRIRASLTDVPVVGSLPSVPPVPGSVVSPAPNAPVPGTPNPTDAAAGGVEPVLPVPTPSLPIPRLPLPTLPVPGLPLPSVPIPPVGP